MFLKLVLFCDHFKPMASHRGAFDLQSGRGVEQHYRLRREMQGGVDVDRISRNGFAEWLQNDRDGAKKIRHWTRALFHFARTKYVAQVFALRKRVNWRHFIAKFCHDVKTISADSSQAFRQSHSECPAMDRAQDKSIEQAEVPWFSFVLPCFPLFRSGTWCFMK